jgi:hypothetical protein
MVPTFLGLDRLWFGAILDKAKSRIQEYPNRARSDTANDL